VADAGPAFREPSALERFFNRAFGALVGMGIPEYEAKRYEGRVKNGGVLLSVHCSTSDEIARAKEILKRTGADDIASTGEEAVGAGSKRDTRL